MRRFNKDSALLKNKLSKNKDTYIKIGSIILSVFIVLFLIIYFTYASFIQLKEFTIIDADVLEFKGQYLVTLDADGGVIENDTLTVGRMTPIGDIESPTKTGYTFDGWYYQNGNPVSSTDKIRDDITITAHYTPLRYTITVNNGTGSGTYDYGTQVTITASVPSTTYSSWGGQTANGMGNIKSRTKTTYTLSKWSDEDTSQSRTITVTGDATYTAQFSTSVTTEKQQYQVTNVPCVAIRDEYDYYGAPITNNGPNYTLSTTANVGVWKYFNGTTGVSSMCTPTSNGKFCSGFYIIFAYDSGYVQFQMSTRLNHKCKDEYNARYKLYCAGLDFSNAVLNINCGSEGQNRQDSYSSQGWGNYTTIGKECKSDWTCDWVSIS